MTLRVTSCLCGEASSVSPCPLSRRSKSNSPILLRGAAQVETRGRTPPEARTQPRDRQAAAGQVRHRPDRVRRPPRAHRPAAEAAAVPGTRPHGGAHHRHRHGRGRRPERPGRVPAGADPGADRQERRRPTSTQIAKVMDVTKAEVRPNGDWFAQFGFADDAAAARPARPCSGCWNATTSASGSTAGTPDLPARVPVPADAGARQRRDPGRRGTRRHRAAVQPDGRPRPAAGRRAGAAGVPDDADPPRRSTARRRWARASATTSALNEPAKEQFGKTMRIPDGLLREWFTLLTDRPADGDRRARRRPPERGEEAARRRTSSRWLPRRRRRPRPGAGRLAEAVRGEKRDPDHIDEVTVPAAEVPGGEVAAT